MPQNDCVHSKGLTGKRPKRTPRAKPRRAPTNRSRAPVRRRLRVRSSSSWSFQAMVQLEASWAWCGPFHRHRHARATGRCGLGSPSAGAHALWQVSNLISSQSGYRGGGVPTARPCAGCELGQSNVPCDRNADPEEKTI